jgi:hypothetical protein
MQMLEWALNQMYLHGTGDAARVKLAEGDPEALRAVKLLELMMIRGHHWFRDRIADLVPAHVEGQRLGIEAAGIEGYRRSHDIVWTECFMNYCCDLSGQGLALQPDWQRKATIIWSNIGREIEAGVFPDFDPVKRGRFRRDQ